MHRAIQSLSFILAISVVRHAAAQSIGPDIVVAEINGIENYSAMGGNDAFSFGSSACNLGTASVSFSGSTAQHPLLFQNLLRLENGQLEQIGYSWGRNEVTALAFTGLCGSCSNPGSPSLLGAGCWTLSTAQVNGIQSNLYPRFLVDPSTGSFPFPVTLGSPSGVLDRRLQIAISDIDPALHPTALYFVEAHYIAADDAAAGNGTNNMSYRQVNFSGGSPNFMASLSGVTTIGRSAIDAWKQHDAAVVVQNLDAAGIGRFQVGFRVTPLPGGISRVQVAVRNHDVGLGAIGLQIHFPAPATVTNVAFHDVNYHSGDPNSGADWSTLVAPMTTVLGFLGTSLGDPNGNVLRFGTTYSFFFDSTIPPSFGEILSVTSIGFSFCEATGAVGAGAPFEQAFDDLGIQMTLPPCVGGTAIGPALEIETSDEASRIRILDTADAALPLGTAQPSGMNGPFALVLDRAVAGPPVTNTVAWHIDGLASNVSGSGFEIRLLLRDLDDEFDLEDVIALSDGVTPGAAVFANGLPSPNPGHGGFKETLLEDWNAVQLGSEWREFQFLVDAEFLAARGLVMSNDMRLIVRQRGSGSAPDDGLAIDAVRIDAATSSSFPYAETFDSLTWNGNGPGTTTPPQGWSQSSTDASGAGGDWVFRNTPVPTDPFGPPADATTGVAGLGYYACAGPIALGPEITMISDPVNVDHLSLSRYVTIRVFNNSPSAMTQSEVHVDLVGLHFNGTTTIIPDIIPAIGHQGPKWKKFASPNLVGTTNQFQRVRVRLRAASVVSTSMQRVCVDDVTFSQLGFGGGVPSEPLKSLKAGPSTQEINGFEIDSGFPGPYYAQVQAGSAFDICIRAQPFQPAILLLSSALGPPILAFGPELQLDLLPPLTVIGDGFSGVFLLGSDMVSDAGGRIVLSVPDTVTPVLIGLSIPMQVVVSTPGSGPFGIATTNAVQLSIF